MNKLERSGDKNGEAFDLLVELAGQKRKSNPDAALIYLNNAYKIAISKRDRNQQAVVLFEIGRIYVDKLAFFTALEYKLRAYKLMIQDGKISHTGYYLVGIGNCYFHLNYFPLAEKYYRKALDVFSRDSNYFGNSVALNNLGLIQKQYGEFDSALIYFNKALENRQKKKEAASIGHSYFYIGSVYFEQGKLKEAKKLLTESLALLNTPSQEISLQHDYLTTLADVHFLLGKLYGKENEIRLSMKHLQTAILIYDTIREAIFIPQVYHYMGSVYQSLKDYSSAKTCYRKAYRVADSVHDTKSEQDFFKNMIQFFVETKQPDSIYYYFKGYSQVTDSLEAQMIASKFKEINLAMQFNEVENDARILKEKNTAYISYIISACIILILIVSGSFFYIAKQRKHRREAAIEIAARKQAEHEKELLNQELKQLNASKDRFISIMAHDLKGPFNALIGFSDLMVEHSQDSAKPELKKYAAIVQQISKSSFQLLENLMLWSRLQLGKMTIQRTELDIYNEVELAVNMQIANAFRKNIKIVNELGKNLPVMADSNFIQTILRNLISNAVKFSHHDSQIVISLDSRDGYREIHITDSGVGISSQNAGKLFKLNSVYTSKGTDNETGNGLGLLLCKDMVEKGGGTLWFESRPGEGTTFTFTVPVE
ncbi:MAG: tetratricopeptide repeat-containing sensor histidine kinase [Bacteroidetes bacterium]|nr:tetratricopeptide repeat-containing sensor histidine kinase [Bacteroidota bacterium]